MKMRKLSMAALAVLAMGAVQAATPDVVQTNTGVEVSHKQDNQEDKKVKQSRAIAPDLHGGLNFGFYDRGLSPKEYGQYLQRSGKQKWIKRKSTGTIVKKTRSLDFS